MIRYLLDTNIVSFFLKKSHPALETRLLNTARTDIAISAISEGELRYGVAKLPADARLPALVEGFIESIEIAAWTSTCAQHYAALRARLEQQGASMSLADTMLAAHALAFDLTFVTNDQAFRRIDRLKLQDWTQPAS